MLKRKSLIVGLVVMSVFTVGLVGCGDNKIDDSKNTKVEDSKKEDAKKEVDKKEDSKKTLTEEQFLEKGKNQIKKLNEIIKKYGGSSKYNNNVSKSQDDDSRGYFLVERENPPINDGSNGRYQVLYSAAVLNGSGKETFNARLYLKPEGNIDINSYKALKEMLIVATGDDKFDFDKFNEIANRLLESKTNENVDKESDNKDLIKNYDSAIKVTVNEKEKLLSIDIADKNVKLDK